MTTAVASGVDLVLSVHSASSPWFCPMIERSKTLIQTLPGTTRKSFNTAIARPSSRARSSTLPVFALLRTGTSVSPRSSSPTVSSSSASSSRASSPTLSPQSPPKFKLSAKAREFRPSIPRNLTATEEQTCKAVWPVLLIPLQVFNVAPVWYVKRQAG